MRIQDIILSVIPPRFHQRAVNLKNHLWGGYRAYYYSQFGKDVVITALLKNKKVFYVDVGANHSLRYSNTALLYERGWHSINIEPNPEAFPFFKKAHPRDISLTLGVATKAGMLLYHRFSDPAFNTFSVEETQKLRSKRWLTELPSLKITVATLADILKKNVKPNEKIDFLNIDVEGGDLSVLESNDWEYFKPEVIAVESHQFNKKTSGEDKINLLLSQKSYQFVIRMGPTIIFRNNGSNICRDGRVFTITSRCYDKTMHLSHLSKT